MKKSGVASRFHNAEPNQNKFLTLKLRVTSSIVYQLLVPGPKETVAMLKKSWLAPWAGRAFFSYHNQTCIHNVSFHLHKELLPLNITNKAVWITLHRIWKVFTWHSHVPGNHKFSGLEKVLSQGEQVLWCKCSLTLPAAPVPPVSAMSSVLSQSHSWTAQLSHTPTGPWEHCPHSWVVLGKYTTSKSYLLSSCLSTRTGQAS